MTIQVDDHSPFPAVAGATALAVDAGRYVHPATRMTVGHSAVAPFGVVCDPVTGRLDLVGEFDLACGPQFRDASVAILAADDVSVDLTRLRFIDASGIGILVGLRNTLAARKATLRIVNADAWIGRVFSLCGLDAMLTGLPVP
jgi:anti-sigma B factor antagonist